jgi:galactosamine-6-phosphate isomerase
MNARVFPTYDALSSQAADDLISMLSSIERPLVCVASGDSPAGLYRTIIQRVQNKETDISNWLFVGLDEWVGMNGNDEGSCRFHLNKQFFDPLQIEQERTCFFDGRASNPEAECMRIENFIQQHGGIDVAIIGLGMNGHVGMNEPGTSSLLHSHLSEIDPQTQQAGQKYFSQPTKLSHGLTLGIANLKEAKNILLIANGEHKASIVKKILNEDPSEQLPATLLHNHPGLRIYLDKSAAQFISNE